MTDITQRLSDRHDAELKDAMDGGYHNDPIFVDAKGEIERQGHLLQRIHEHTFSCPYSLVCCPECAALSLEIQGKPSSACRDTWISNKALCCILKAGHEGSHSDGRYSWTFAPAAGPLKT
jgi:hypothetical protein